MDEHWAVLLPCDPEAAENDGVGFVAMVKDHSQQGLGCVIEALDEASDMEEVLQLESLEAGKDVCRTSRHLYEC